MHFHQNPQKLERDLRLEDVGVCMHYRDSSPGYTFHVLIGLVKCYVKYTVVIFQVLNDCVRVTSSQYALQIIECEVGGH